MNTSPEISINAPNPPLPTQQSTQTNTNKPYQLTLPQTTVQQQGAVVSTNAPPMVQQASNTVPSTITTKNIGNTTSTQYQHQQQQPQQQQQQQQSNIIPDLASYISAPTTERIARLENWICEHIQDDDFLRLCQDVEGVWKRVAFGS